MLATLAAAAIGSLRAFDNELGASMQGQSVASAHFLLCRAVFWVSTVVSVMNANSTRNALPLCSQIMVRILGAATHHTSHSNAPSQKKLAICTLLITDHAQMCDVGCGGCSRRVTVLRWGELGKVGGKFLVIYRLAFCNGPRHAFIIWSAPSLRLLFLFVTTNGQPGQPGTIS